jgi:nucleoid-associated protein YgaU
MTTSRYRNTIDQNKDEHTTFYFAKAEDVQSSNDIFYKIKEGERLDTISKKFFRDPKYWWVIAIANNISFPFGDETKAGTIIRIPSNVNNVLLRI